MLIMQLLKIINNQQSNILNKTMEEINTKTEQISKIVSNYQYKGDFTDSYSCDIPGYIPD
jgi:hypothetical protein